MVKKIVLMDGLGANHFIREALYNAIRLNPNYQIFFWNDQGKSPYDLFAEIPDMDIFIGSTWQLTRAIVKNLSARPNIKVALFADSYGELEKDLDKNLYPVSFLTKDQFELIEELKKSHPEILTITQHNESAKEYTHGYYNSKLGLNVLSLNCCADITQCFLTEPKEEYSVDWIYTGSNWNFKSKYLNQYILPLCYPHTNLRGKILGGGGWSTPNFCGKANEDTIRNYYASAKFVPSIYEPHAVEVYSDVPQRPFQVAACGGFQISQTAIGLDELFTEDEIFTVPSAETFRLFLQNYLTNKEDWSIPYRKLGSRRVYREHTNLHRAAKLLTALAEDNSWFLDQAENLFTKTFPGEKYATNSN